MARLSPKKGYDLYAADYHRDHLHLNSFENGIDNRWWFEALERQLDRNQLVRALDLGCGDGRSLARWEGRLKKARLAERVELWGFDFSRHMLEQARKRLKHVQLELVDLQDAAGLRQWSGKHGGAHLVSALFVLVHFSKPQDFFAAADSLVAPGGCLLINTIPQKHPPVLNAAGKSIVIDAWHHPIDTVLEAAHWAGFSLLRRQAFVEKDELVSTLLEFEKSAPSVA